MIEVNCEGTRFKYLPAREVEADELRKLQFALDDATVARLCRGEDTRLALFEFQLSPNQWLAYWLVWQTPVDLLALDQRVRDGTYRTEDFAPSIRTMHQRTWCLDCGKIVPTLIVDSADPYPGAANLLREKLTKFRILQCPNCGYSLRQLVVKFIENHECGNTDPTTGRR